MRSASLFVVHIVKHSGVARGRRGFILNTWTQRKRGGGVAEGGRAGDSGSLDSNIDNTKSICQCHLLVVCMSGM